MTSSKIAAGVVGDRSENGVTLRWNPYAVNRGGFQSCPFLLTICSTMLLALAANVPVPR